MRHDLSELWQEAQKALETVWFISSLEETERTDITLSFRLMIREDLFVQVFSGQKSMSLYMALVEGRRRIYGIDREGNEWHVHPFESADRHEPLAPGLGPKPLLSFLSRVEELLVKTALL
jgi:hypothetical protein